MSRCVAPANDLLTRYRGNGAPGSLTLVATPFISVSNTNDISRAYCEEIVFKLEIFQRAEKTHLTQI